MSADSPHCPGCPLTVAQWAALRAWLGVPDSLPDDRVGDALVTALATDRLLADELSYLEFATQFGWAHWSLDT